MSIKRFISLFVCMTLCVGMVIAQDRRVTGTVVAEEDGLPVIGATVLVKGTQIGVVTNVDGVFVLSKVPSSATTLVVSYVGMQTQEVAIKPNLKVSLRTSAELLDEVMVVAFGTAKKSAFTGSATVVSSEELEKKITTNIADALVGSTPGLQLRGGSGAPGASQGSISIRGISSLYADTDPLIIVDGAPYSASLSNIPQGDVESITVLKDAASAALYGARGAAGVILITTKSGANKKAQINVDMKWGTNSRAVQRYKTINDPGRYMETIYKQYYNYYYYDQGQTVANANANANDLMLNHLSYNIYTVPDGQYLIGTDGKLNSNASLGYTYEYDDETYYIINDDWDDAAYRNALRQEYTVNINGSNDRGSYYASIGYLDEKGVIVESGYKRLTARLKADYKARDWLKIGANVGFVNSRQDSNPNMGTSWNSTNLMYYTSYIAPIYPIYVRVLDENGNPQIRTDENGNPQYDYGVSGTGYTGYPGLTRPFLSTGNPLGSNHYNEVYTDGRQLNGTLNLDINLTSFLKFNATSTINWGHSNYSDYETSLYGPKVSVNGQLEKSQTDSFRQNHVQTLTYFDKFGKHDVNVLVGHEYYNTKTTYLYAYGQGVFSSDVQELNAVANPISSSSYTSEYNVEGYFGSLQYNYDEKYFLSASYRRDASSRFDKEHRWGNFWSVGGAWLMSKEDFLHLPSWVDQLKLKFSIGQQGNDNIGDWAYTDLYELTAASETQMSATFYRMGNSEITWETTTNMNVGVEFSLFSGRLTGNFDYYNKKTTDLLFWLSVPESVGTRGYYGNIGDIRNQGIELSLQGSVIRTKNIDWSLQFNISHNSDKILSLPESKISNGGFTESNKWFKVGGHLYNYFLREYAGVDAQGQALYWVDEDLGEGVTSYPGKKHSYTTTNPNNATKYEQGNSLPAAYGGFGTTLTAYGFDVSLTFDYQIGGKIYDNMYAYLMGNWSSSGDAGYAIHEDILKAWSPNNTSSDIPRYQYGDSYATSTSDRFMTKASYLNFQSFTVGYTIPEKYLSRFNISKLRIYASGENLCFWSARRGLDPRYSYGATASTTVYSPVRTIMGGIQLSF